MSHNKFLFLLIVSPIFCLPLVSHAETEWEKYYRELDAYNSQFLTHIVSDFSFVNGQSKMSPGYATVKSGEKKKRVGDVKFTWNEIDATVTTLRMLAWGSEGDTPWGCFDTLRLMKNKKVVGTFKASDKKNWQVYPVDAERDKHYEYWTLSFTGVKIPLKDGERVSLTVHADAKKGLSGAEKAQCGVRLSIPSDNIVAEPKKSLKSTYKYYYVSYHGLPTQKNDLLLEVI